MIFRLNTDDEPTLRLDEEGIDYLIVGLEQLRELEPGRQITAPSLDSKDGVPTGVSEFVLERA